MKLVVVDLETTGLNPVQDEIIEFAAVRVANGQIEDTFHSLIRPDSAVPKEVTELTGIADKDLKKAPRLEEVLPQFLAFIEGHTVAGHNVSFDYEFLEAACEGTGYEMPVNRDVLDTLQLAHILLPTEREYRLQNIADRLGIAASGWHRALNDTMATYSILRELAVVAQALPYITLQEMSRISALFSPVTALWFQEQADVRLATDGVTLPENTEIIAQLVFSKEQLEINAHPSSATETEIAEGGQPDTTCSKQPPVQKSTDWLGQESPLSTILPGFEVRAGQQEMVSAVVAAFEGDSHLIVEAGTGTGKSLAYLIPSALYAKQHDTRVVVSTHTIALQDQIENRDFPTLQKIVGNDLRLAVLKGRTHYVCMRKLQQESMHLTFATPVAEIVVYLAFLSWLVQTEHGMREELSLRGSSLSVWPRIQSETESCIHKRCPFFKPCYYFRARGHAYEADVVVTNHSLVLSDVKADHRVLPSYDKLVLDEAHHLADQATKHLGNEVRQSQCFALLGRLSRDKGKHGIIPELIRREDTNHGGATRVAEKLSALSEHIESLYGQFDQVFQALGSLVNTNQGELRITGEIRALPVWKYYLEIINEMDPALASLRHTQGDLKAWGEAEENSEKAGRWLDAAGFLEELFGQVEGLRAVRESNDGWVEWVERTGNGRHSHVTLHAAPIDVADILDKQLFNKKSSIVLTSATLSVNQTFDYTIEQLGLIRSKRENKLLTLTVGSPFDYQKQALLCVPSDVPELAKLEPSVAATWLSDSIYQLAKASGGRLLALFTSHALLRMTAQAVRDPLASANLRLYAQGIDGNRTHLLQAFKASEGAVLFGAQSFWEGIDLPGDELTTLVIVRLPFAPPTHPVSQARHERLEQSGKNPFMADSLPEAIVKFRQGFGRLIRRVNDSGVVVVYDKRLVTARYGQAFIKSLDGVRPFVAPEQTVLREVEKFLRSSRKGGTE